MTARWQWWTDPPTTPEMVTIPCPSCDGAGTVYRTAWASHRATCRECEGTGTAQIPADEIEEPK